jgi:hypothetical protein
MRAFMTPIGQRTKPFGRRSGDCSTVSRASASALKCGNGKAQKALLEVGDIAEAIDPTARDA